VNAVVIWRPEPLTARLIAAATPARAEWAALARARCTSRRVASSIRVAGDAVAATHPLAPIVERGAGPHAIGEKGQVLRLASGRFVTGPIEHPGTPAKPFLRPTLPAWVGLYRRVAAGALRGF
jgi:hypothetical protein